MGSTPLFWPKLLTGIDENGKRLSTKKELQSIADQLAILGKGLGDDFPRLDLVCQSLGNLLYYCFFPFHLQQKLDPLFGIECMIE